MPIQIDPEGHEIAALQKLVVLDNREVLEIGCGDGRLTFRYAAWPRHVYALDPDAASIETAMHNTPPQLSGKIEFRQGSAEHLKFPKETFDIALLAWSL
jgi:ubiquinone/menaquinone biosynthesis C-methylase UbiE